MSNVMSNVEAKITVGGDWSHSSKTLGFSPIPSLEEAWQEEFRSEDWHLSEGAAPDPDDGCWTLVLIGKDAGGYEDETLEINLDHGADRVPTIAQIVEALDQHLAGPCQLVVELGYVERYGGRGPLQMDLELRPVLD